MNDDAPPGPVDTVTRRGVATSVVLAGIAAIHIGWGRGASFPFRDRATLADSAVGSARVPDPAACYGVAGLLLAASALTADLPVAPRRARRIGRIVVAASLAGRGLLGLAGRTDLVSPGSTSTRFRRLDRAVYSPLVLTIGAGVATAVRRDARADVLDRIERRPKGASSAEAAIEAVEKERARR